MDRAEEIIKYWFGRVESTLLPTENRTRIWFGDDFGTDEEIRIKFDEDYKKACEQKLSDWEKSNRGTLALIILFDQISRHIHRGTSSAYMMDQKALDLCLQGIERQFDHELSLIERAFFYFPLMHSEDLEMQATAVRAYKILVDLSFSEARGVYESFLDYALKHFEIIKRFGRFPQRNAALGRIPTSEEISFLKQSGIEPGNT